MNSVLRIGQPMLVAMRFPIQAVFQFTHTAHEIGGIVRFPRISLTCHQYDATSGAASGAATQIAHLVLETSSLCLF